MLSSLEFHKDFKAWRVSTHEIGVSGFNFSQNISQEALTALLFEPNNQDFSWRAEEEALVNFKLERENDHSFIVFIKTNLLLSNPCVRCLDPVSLPLNLDFSVRMLEKEHFGSDEDNFSCLTEDDFLDNNEALVGYFSHKCIDLGIILRDQIFLEVPDYPQCGMGKDAVATCNKSLPLTKNQDGQQENPFVKLFRKSK